MTLGNRLLEDDLKLSGSLVAKDVQGFSECRLVQVQTALPLAQFLDQNVVVEDYVRAFKIAAPSIGPAIVTDECGLR